MDLKEFFKVRGRQRFFVLTGLLFIVSAVLLFFGRLAGLMPDDFFVLFGQQSEIRFIAGLAVTGCLLAAFGYIQ